MKNTKTNFKFVTEWKPKRKTRNRLIMWLSKGKQPTNHNGVNFYYACDVCVLRIKKNRKWMHIREKTGGFSNRNTFSYQEKEIGSFVQALKLKLKLKKVFTIQSTEQRSNFAKFNSYVLIFLWFSVEFILFWSHRISFFELILMRSFGLPVGTSSNSRSIYVREFIGTKEF